MLLRGIERREQAERDLTLTQRAVDQSADPIYWVQENGRVRYANNAARVRNRESLVPIVESLTVKQSSAFWLRGLEERKVPCGPVNDIPAAFNDPQTVHRGMEISMPHALAGSGEVSLIANPVKFSDSPVSYRRAPPQLGEHTAEVLEELLGLDADARRTLSEQDII